MQAAGWCAAVAGRGGHCTLSSRALSFYDTVQRDGCRELGAGLHSLASRGIQRAETVAQNARAEQQHT
jgi:hypothetical protein